MSKPSTPFTALQSALSSRLRQRLGRLAAVEPGEMRALCWSFAYFFALLCSYYIIRPMRDEMGIAGGVDKLQWMFSGTFLVMLARSAAFRLGGQTISGTAVFAVCLLFFYGQPGAVFRLFQIGSDACLRCAGLFHLGQCLQFVYRFGFLEFHDGHIQQRSGPATFRRYCSRRHGRGLDRSCSYGCTGQNSGAGEYAADLRCLSGGRRLVHPSDHRLEKVNRY